MKFLLGFLVIYFSASTVFGVELEGKAVQGGLIRGMTEPGAAVTLDGKPIRVSPDGVFIFGFSRDATGEAQLTVQLLNGTTEQKKLQIEKRTFRIQRIDGLPKKMVTPPKDVLDRIRRENAEIAKVRLVDRPQAFFESGWIWPAKGRISGVYGSQRILNGEPRQPHFGIDIAAPAGTPVVAPADGVVVLAEKDLYYTGGTVILDHGHGLTSAFLHLSSVDVAVGMKIRQGGHLGNIGATGRSTGPHLDWRINWFDRRIDPQFLVPPMPGQ